MKRFFVAFSAALLLMILVGFNPALAQVSQPDCKVSIDGKLAPYQPRYVKGNVGEHVFYWCVRPDGFTVTNGFSCPFTTPECGIGAFSSRMAGIMAAADRPAAAASAWATAFTYSCTPEIRTENSDRGRMCVERKSVLDANYASWTAGLVQPVPPPVVTYIVAKNTTYPDRPSFAVVNGVRSFSSKTRVLVGTPCGEVYLMEGTTRYGQVSDVPLLVAVCTKTP